MLLLVCTSCRLCINVRDVTVVILPGGNVTETNLLMPCDIIFIDNQEIYHICTPRNQNCAPSTVLLRSSRRGGDDDKKNPRCSEELFCVTVCDAVGSACGKIIKG
jgi:hypothetical protein